MVLGTPIVVEYVMAIIEPSTRVSGGPVWRLVRPGVRQQRSNPSGRRRFSRFSLKPRKPTPAQPTRSISPLPMFPCLRYVLCQQAQLPNAAWYNYLVESLDFSDWDIGLVNISAQVCVYF